MTRLHSKQSPERNCPLRNFPAGWDSARFRGVSDPLAPKLRHRSYRSDPPCLRQGSTPCQGPGAHKGGLPFQPILCAAERLSPSARDKRSEAACVESRPVTRSSRATPRLPASLSAVSTRGIRSPRSSRLTSVRWIEARKLSSSWETSAPLRQRARFSPKRTFISGVGGAEAGAQGLTAALPPAWRPPSVRVQRVEVERRASSHRP